MHSGTFRGSFVVKACAVTTDWPTPLPVAGWHSAQPTSLVAGPPVWFAPVVQLMRSWQEPQASRDGTVFQLFTSAPPPVWHTTQFSSRAGNAAERQEAVSEP